MTENESVDRKSIIEYIKNFFDFDDTLVDYCEQNVLFGSGKNAGLDVQFKDISECKIVTAMAYEFAKLEYVVSINSNVGLIPKLLKKASQKMGIKCDDVDLIATMSFTWNYMERYMKSKKIDNFNYNNFYDYGYKKFGLDFIILMRSIAFMYRYNSIVKIADDVFRFAINDESDGLVFNDEVSFNQFKNEFGNSKFAITSRLQNDVKIVDYIKWSKDFKPIVSIV